MLTRYFALATLEAFRNVCVYVRMLVQQSRDQLICNGQAKNWTGSQL